MNPGPTSVVRPAGIVTVIGGGLDTGPPPSIRESRTSTGAVPGLAKDTAHLPLGAAVPACITHAAAGWAPTVEPWSPCGPNVLRATATPAEELTVNWIEEAGDVESS